MEIGMNIMRKLWVGGTGGGNGGGGIGGNSGMATVSSNQILSLGLMHLRKLFTEYLHSPSEEKIYNMLPLFCKIFGTTAASEMVDKFPEINSFAQSVSKLMVTEVRKRASNQSSEAAAIAIVQFLEAGNETDDSKGGSLLTTLNLISAGDQNLVEVMISASVPSTLVKCLCLFFDLPEVQPPELKGPTSDFSPMERRLLLQKVFVQLLIRLSSHPALAEELARKDDLGLLFSAVTSWCPPHNAVWRKSASEVLMTISTHGLKSSVLSYLHRKRCIQTCIDNLKLGSHFMPLELIEMVLTVFCFLKDSIEMSQVLLDDFKSAQGYQFLTEALLILENDLTAESQEAIRNLMLVVSSLSMFGQTPLKPNIAQLDSHLSLVGFQMPSAGTKGSSVRNLQAFQVLQTVFSKSNTSFLSSVCLDSISSIFKADHINYFIVDCLPQMAEKLISKTPEVQQKYLELVEFVVFQLKFPAFKELISISWILKNDMSESSVTSVSKTIQNTKVTSAEIKNELTLKLICVKMLLSLVKHNSLFKEIYKEVGILEVLITCLHRFSCDVQHPDSNKDTLMSAKTELGLAVMELLSCILAGNNGNVPIFRENNASKCSLQLITASKNLRTAALSLVQQLLMSPGGEEEMASLLVTLHAADIETEIDLKIEILGTMLACFRETHRARCNFRKAGGFLYLMSLLVSMEGLLVKNSISAIVLKERMHLVHLIFTSFALAMRFEPGNAKLFQQEICLPSLADTLRLLGCFSREKQIIPTGRLNPLGLVQETAAETEDHIQLFHSIFTSSPANVDPSNLQNKLPMTLILAVFIFRLLYDLTTDNFEKNQIPAGSTSCISGPFRSPRKQLTEDSSFGSTPSSPTRNSTATQGPREKKNFVGTLNLSPPTPEPVIIHSSVVIVMLKLIPSISVLPQDEDMTESEDCDRKLLWLENLCQLYCAELVKSLVRNERNQQSMAPVGLIDEILDKFSEALNDESHFLHLPIHYAFERVATHNLSPKDLRRFLRLGNPVNCERASLLTSNVSSICSPVPLSRVKSLVSMTTPKSSSHQSNQAMVSSYYTNSSTPFPAFVEFDMAAEGFGCLYLPSVAPHVFPYGTEFGSASLLASGIGSTGISYSTWFCVDKFSDPRNDPHPVRIFTLMKEINGIQKLSLSIIVSSKDKSLLISTKETPLPVAGVGDWEPVITAPSSSAVRIWCPELLHEGQWHHLFLSFSLSPSHPFTLYVNGRPAHNCKLEYPHRSKGANYSAFIGSPPVWRKFSRLTWRQGMCHLFEDWVPSAQTVTQIWKLGPEYPGSWQAVKIQGEIYGNIVSEDKLVFGLNALAVSQLTLAKIRKLYTKADAKSIAKQLGLSSHENATPISILHNSAAHLMGPGRSLGGVVIGYLGVRIFNPLPVSKSILSVGGMPVLIGLVAMASSGESLYAALKALVGVVKSTSLNSTPSTYLIDKSCWQMLGYLLKRKKHLLSMRILHLVFGLVSNETVAMLQEQKGGFLDLLADLDIWCGSPSHPSFISLWATERSKTLDDSINSNSDIDSPKKQGSLESNETGDCNFIDLEKALYEHLLQMIAEDQKTSLDLLREAGIVSRLLRRLSQSTCNQTSIFLLLSHLLSAKGRSASVDLITFGHFIASTIPQSLNNKENCTTDLIELRNKGLQLLHSLMYSGKQLNIAFCGEIVNKLGFDFVLLFASPHLHSSTLLWSLRILLLLITSSTNSRDLKSRFKEGSSSAFIFAKSIQVANNTAFRSATKVLPVKKQDHRAGATPEDDQVSKDPVVTVATIAGNLSKLGSKGVSGWARLSWLLSRRCEATDSANEQPLPTEVWLILCALVLSQPCRNVSMKLENNQLTLDSIWQYVFAVPSSRMTSSLYGKVVLCPDAIITVLTLVRCLLSVDVPGNEKSINGIVSETSNSEKSSSYSNASDIGSCIVQFLCYLYSSTPEFQSVFTCNDILSSLSATMLPLDMKNSLTSETLDAVDCDDSREGHGQIQRDESNEKETKSTDNESIFDSNDGDTVDSSEFSNNNSVSSQSGTEKFGRTLNMMNHPAKKIVLDFIRIIIIDWMSSTSSSSQSKNANAMCAVIDTVLDAGVYDYSEGAILEATVVGDNGIQKFPQEIIIQFHTNVLGTLLDHLTSFDIERLFGYLHSVALFISRVVDKLWLDTFSRDPNVVMDFILVLVNHCRTKRVPAATTDMIYNSLNRVILYVLSRRNNQWVKVEALKKLRNARTVIFGSGNHQHEFYGCIVYILLQLVEGLPICVEGGNRTQWHVRVTAPGDENNDDLHTNATNIQEAVRVDSELSCTAEKVWEDLYISKKPLVEDLFKISLHSPKPPPLSSLREGIRDTAHKLWMSYVTSETTYVKKSTHSTGLGQSWEIHQQLQSKLQKVTGGLTKLALAGRSSIRKDSEKEKNSKDLICQWSDARRLSFANLQNLKQIKEIISSQEKFHLDNVRHLNRFVRDALLPQLESELTRERGLWGPFLPTHLDKWMLDTTEGPCRMRKKLIKNEVFYMHYPYQEPANSNSSSPRSKRINPPISRDAKEFYKKFKYQPALISDLITGTYCSSLDEVDEMCVSSATSECVSSPKVSTSSAPDEAFPEGSYDEASDLDNQSMLFRLIGTNREKITQMFRVAQIQGLDTTEGLLLFGRDSFYLVSGFTILTKTREVKDMYYLPAHMYEPILPPQCYGTGPSPAKPRSKAHSCLKFSFEDIREVHKRRYLLQHIALEIFCSDGRNYLLAFPRKLRNVVFQRFTAVSKNLSDSSDAKQSVAGQRRTASVEQSTGIFSSLMVMGETSVTQRWVRGEISNFQYLMHLNSLAGRSYNDLMQYPVFPWILADYDSSVLDLTSPPTFRDLSKPMGAQHKGRLEQFIKRFKEWDDPHGETPPYHYGTHYSSEMIVCSYLVRMEPFAQHFLRLQGGHFDLADRMFHSIKEAWTSASRHNMADVKELIPEFFYLPEFLVNSNNFELGFKQNGTPLNEVVLPPWAKGDPKEFIRVHRMALECDYVSQHLHEWIDLIFGFRQQGAAAIESVNVFHHLFYEGNVDINTIDDPLKKNATIGFINNFGQIPKQLFKRPHPSKKVSTAGATASMSLMNLNILDTANPLMALAATAGSALGQNSSSEKLFYHHIDSLRPTMAPIKELKGPVGHIMPLDRANSIVAVEQNKFLISSTKYVSWGFADYSLRVCHVDTDRATFIWEQSHQQLALGNIGEILSCTAPSDKYIVTGSSNSVVSVWELGDRDIKLKSHLFGHTEAICCVASSAAYNIIVSGSRDSTCIVWDLARLTFVRQLVPHAGPIDCIGINELSGDIATCDSSWLRLWSVNGEPIGKLDTAGIGGGGGMTQGILCVCFSHLNEWDADNVILTGSSDGIVRVWSLRYVQIPKSEILAGCPSTRNSIPPSSISDDSSCISGADSEVHRDESTELIEEDLLDDNTVALEVSKEKSNVEVMCKLEVLDPDKDRDSTEDLRSDTKRSEEILEEENTKIDDSIEVKELNLFTIEENMCLHPEETIGEEEKARNVIRRQRALSSGNSNDSANNRKSLESMKSKRLSDIPPGGGNNEGLNRPGSSNSAFIRGSKSETSLSFDTDESFEVVTEAEVANAKLEERKLSQGAAILAAHQLKDGHVWQKRIVFRGKLTMHTACDRKDNTEPASITALGISRDHKNIYVGDARARVYSWAVSESAAGRADHWVRDETSDNCNSCQVKFSLTERKHHCRNCGQLFCSKCSRYESEIFRLRILRPVRVCQKCYYSLKGRASSESLE